MMSNQNLNNTNNHAKETINMKKSVRSFESIIVAAKKQEKQLDAARKAWAAAKDVGAKKLAQKAGENAKKNLAALREEWKTAKASQAVPATQPSVVKKAAPTSSNWENQLVRARQAWAKAKAADDTRGMEAARKAGELAKAKLAGATAGTQAAVEEAVPVVAKPAVFGKGAELKKKYHELKVRGINELVAEYREEEEALRAKYAAKKEELINGLLKLYKEELANQDGAQESPVMEEVIEHLKEEVPCSNLKEELKEELELIKAEDSSFVPVPVEEAKNIHVEEGAIVETAPVSVEVPITEEANAIDKTPVVEKVEIYVDPELDSIAASAMESNSGTRLNHGETFLDENGNTYVVETFFEYVVFTVSDRAVQEKMIREALANGDIRMAKKTAA